MPIQCNRRKAFLALVLLVPAPSIGALCGMVLFPDSLPGVLLFSLSKVWLFGFPLVWTLRVDRAPLRFSPMRRGGLPMGILSGLALSGVILAAYFLMGDGFIDREMMSGKLETIGLGSPAVFWIGAAYWILVNSVLEEYVWRWFCVKQCVTLMQPVWAVMGSALFFTLHHIVAMRVYLGTPAVVACAFGVFLGGAIWSAMYIQYRSIWPGYVSHALVDLCIFAIAASILF